jgi:hypothetical protein
MDISGGYKIATDNGYQHRVACSGSETTTDISLKPLQMTLSVVVDAFR